MFWMLHSEMVQTKHIIRLILRNDKTCGIDSFCLTFFVNMLSHESTTNLMKAYKPWFIELLEPDDDDEDTETEDKTNEHNWARKDSSWKIYLKTKMSPEVFWDHLGIWPVTLEGRSQWPDYFHTEEKCWKRGSFWTHEACPFHLEDVDLSTLNMSGSKLVKGRTQYA